MIDDLELLRYLQNKNENSINIADEDYFIQQRLIDKVPALDRQTARLLYFFSSLTKPENILEIGFGSGFSSYSLYLGSKNSIKKITSFEHEKKRYKKGLEFIDKKRLPIDIINEDFGDESIKRVLEKNNIKEFDLIFVDGTKREYPFYYKICINYLRKGGLILFDNILFNGNLLKLTRLNKGRNVEGAKILQSLLDQISNDKSLIPFYFPIGDGLLAAIKR